MIYYGGNDYRDYLAHYGVLGMHWGIRRYQPYSVVPRGSGKTGKEVGFAKKVGEKISEIKTGLHKRSVAKKRLKNLAKARKAKEKKEKQARKEQRRNDKAVLERERILKTGSVDELLKNRHLYDHKELDMAITRLNDEKRLRDLKSAEAYRATDAVKKFIDNAVGYTKSGLSAYSTWKEVQKVIDENSTWAKEKKRITRSDDVKKMLKYQKKFSNDDVKAFAQRHKTLEQLRKSIDEASDDEERRKKPEDDE